MFQNKSQHLYRNAKFPASDNEKYIMFGSQLNGNRHAKKLQNTAHREAGNRSINQKPRMTQTAESARKDVKTVTVFCMVSKLSRNIKDIKRHKMVF